MSIDMNFRSSFKYFIRNTGEQSLTIAAANFRLFRACLMIGFVGLGAFGDQRRPDCDQNNGVKSVCLEYVAVKLNFLSDSAQ